MFVLKQTDQQMSVLSLLVSVDIDCHCRASSSVSLLSHCSPPFLCINTSLLSFLSPAVILTMRAMLNMIVLQIWVLQPTPVQHEGLVRVRLKGLVEHNRVIEIIWLQR